MTEINPHVSLHPALSVSLRHRAVTEWAISEMRRAQIASGHEGCRERPPMHPMDELAGREEFVELTRDYGVVDVVRLSSDTIHVLLERELWPAEVRHVRGLARAWWVLDRVVLAIRVEHPDLEDTYDGVSADLPFRRVSGGD